MIPNSKRRDPQRTLARTLGAVNAKHDGYFCLQVAEYEELLCEIDSIRYSEQQKSLTHSV